MIKKNVNPSTIKEGIDRAILEGQVLTRDELGKALRLDLEMALQVLYEVTFDKELYDAVLTVYWNRYLTKKDQNLEAGSELDALGKEVLQPK